jgi:mono/diheme cytochrome c family protein
MNEQAGARRLVGWERVGLALAAAIAAQCSGPYTSEDVAPSGDEGLAGGGGAAGFGGGKVFEDTRPVVSAPRTPPPVSGGTLLTLGNDRVVIADPDRDRILTVDLAARRKIAEVTLTVGAEPTRLVADPRGVVHVVLRGTGEVASVDPVAGSLLDRRRVCRAPRGIAFDAAADALVVACLEGWLVELSASGDGAMRETFVATDLRDVLLLGTTLVATRFRSAEVLYLDAERHVTKVLKPFEGDEQFSATTAWRAVAAPNGELVIAHQRALDTTINVGGATDGGTGSGGAAGRTGEEPPSGYGSSFDTCASIVQGTITTVTPAGAVLTHSTIPGAALPVDVAVSSRGSIAVANGSLDPEMFGPGTSFVEFAHSTAGVSIECGVSVVRADKIGTVTSVAFDDAGRFLAFSREPSTLWVYGDDGIWEVSLGGEDVTDTGHDMFHADTGNGIACASCHAEGTDDGHVWNFSDFGARRTQPLDVGLEGSAPFHWDGTLGSFGALVHEVFERRMGGPLENAERVQALERYVYGLKRRPPMRGYDEAAARGQVLFESREVGCSTCHTGEKLTNGLSESIGKGNATQVPSLIGVSTRTPLMHDGCAATLRDRFDPACGGDRHGNPEVLDDAELDDLIAYLEAL